MIIGVLTGFSFGWICKDSMETRVSYAVIGVAGALLGLGLYFLSSSDVITGLFSLGATVSEIISALILIALLRVLRKKAPSSH